MLHMDNLEYDGGSFLLLLCGEGGAKYQPPKETVTAK